MGDQAEWIGCGFRDTIRMKRFPTPVVCPKPEPGGGTRPFGPQKGSWIAGKTNQSLTRLSRNQKGKGKKSEIPISKSETNSKFKEILFGTLRF